MSNTTSEMDSLHFDDDPIVDPTTTTKDPDPAPASDPIVDDNPKGDSSSDPVVDPDPTPDPVADTTADNGDGNGDDTSEPDKSTGIERYLSKHNIVAGMVNIEGEEIHFDDLDPESQFNVLENLNSLDRGKGNSGDLDEDEIALINFMRDGEGTIDEKIEAMAQLRVEEKLALAEATGVNFETMDNDAMYTRWLKDSNPEANDDDIAAELTKAKEGKFYESQVSNIKKSYIADQKAKAEESEAAARALQEQENEEDRVAIVNAIQGIEDVVGFPTNEDDTNFVLSKILETGESGDSLFLEEVFGDPKKIFQAAYLYYLGDKKIDGMEEHYKRKITSVRKGVQSELIDGMPSNPITQKTATPDAPPTPPRQKEVVSVNSLHLDDEE